MRKTSLAALAVILLAAPAFAADTPNHAPWDALLKRYVDDKGQVDYKTWKEKDEKAVSEYVKSLEGVDESKLSHEDKLAFWINAYNAITIEAMLGFYPIKSIQEKHSTLGWDIWKDYKRKVAGREVNLDTIEHGILRKMGEPRIHFAINCASKGCPVLRNEAYVGQKVDAQLEDQVQRFLSDPNKFSVNAGDKVVKVSPIIASWFKDDFGASDTQRLTWLARHDKNAAEKKVLLDADTSLKALDYDWSLNEKK